MCDAPNCKREAVTACDGVSMCDYHAQWIAHLSTPADNGQCDNCGRDLYNPGAYLYEYNDWHSCTICQSCYDTGDK